MGNNSGLFFLALIAIPILFLWMSRRQMKRQTETIQTALAPGVEVMTGSGVYGTIQHIADTTVDIEVSPGVTMRWARQAIARVIPPEDDEDAVLSTDDDPYDDDDADDGDTTYDGEPRGNANP